MSRRLYDYWRSSAAYRVRIALNLKGIEHRRVPVDLAAGQQSAADYTVRNPQGLVPLLEDGDIRLTQSQAIIEYLDERYPEPALYPADVLGRARVRAFVATVACDIHPLNNLRVLQYLEGPLGQEAASVKAWYAHWLRTGLQALEAQASGGPYLFGRAVTAAELFLIPQLYNARRFDVALHDFPKLVAVDAVCAELTAFRAAAPEAPTAADPEPSSAH